MPRRSARRPRRRDAVIEALAAELAHGAAAAATATRSAPLALRVRERTGQKGKALFHPIRLALTGEPEGLEAGSRGAGDRARRASDGRCVGSGDPAAGESRGAAERAGGVLTQPSTAEGDVTRQPT